MAAASAPEAGGVRCTIARKRDSGHGLRSPGANIPRKRAFLSMVSPLPRLPWRLSSPSCSRQRSPRCVAPRGGWRHSLSSARLSYPATPPREPPCMGPLGCRCGWHTCSGARTRHGIALSRPLSRYSPSTTAHQIACKNEMRSSISLQVYRAQLSCGRHRPRHHERRESRTTSSIFVGSSQNFR